jgi:hypothetical protein
MKKKLYALSGVFLIALVIAGLWATKAVSLNDVQQTIDPAATSSATGLSMEQMTEDSALIVMGKCVGTRSEWVDRRLVTRATVSVTETIKGAAAGTVDVEMPGGIGNKGKFKLAMTYAGAPRMSPDEEVFLFLTQGEGSDVYSVTGFAQGKFSIAQTDTGEKVVTSDMTKAPVQKGPGLTRGNLQAVSLSEFKERVKSYLNK